MIVLVVLSYDTDIFVLSKNPVSFFESANTVNFESNVASVSSPVFVQEVFQITVRLASVTYRLFEESAVSAVVASAQEVTNHFVSYVIFVFVAQTIPTFDATFVSTYVLVGNCSFV